MNINYRRTIAIRLIYYTWINLVCSLDIRFFKIIPRLQNRYIEVNSYSYNNFAHVVEIDIFENRCKVYAINPSLERNSTFR